MWGAAPPASGQEGCAWNGFWSSAKWSWFKVQGLGLRIQGLEFVCSLKCAGHWLHEALTWPWNRSKKHRFQDFSGAGSTCRLHVSKNEGLQSGNAGLEQYVVVAGRGSHDSKISCPTSCNRSDPVKANEDSFLSNVMAFFREEDSKAMSHRLLLNNCWGDFLPHADGLFTPENSVCFQHDFRLPLSSASSAITPPHSG